MKVSTNITYFQFIRYATVVLFITACDNAPIPTTDKRPNASISAIIAVKKNVAMGLEFPGRITGSQEADIRPQVGGIIIHKYCKDGSFVNAGDMLFQIDPSRYKTALQTAEANVAKALSDKIRATKEIKRISVLVKTGAVSHRVYDDTLASKETAFAHYDAALSALNQAKIDLEYTEVKAPISGIVGKEEITVGNLVSAGSVYPLTKIVNNQPAHVHFSMPSDVHDKIVKHASDGLITAEKNYSVRISDADGTLYPEIGNVVFVGSIEDPITSSIPMKAEIPNISSNLISGQFVKVKLVGINYEDCIVLPVTSIIQTAHGTMVYMIDKNGKVQVKAVTVLDYVGNEVVLKAGLNGGETIISDGIVKIRPGQVVNAIIKTEVGGQ